MDIVYAGTTSSTWFRGFPKNTYNTLDIKSNGKVSIDLKIVGAKESYLRTLQGSKKGNLKYDYGYFWQSYADDLKE